MLLFCREISGPKKRKDGCSLRKLFDFLKKKQYNYRERVASKRKSSLPAARFYYNRMLLCSISGLCIWRILVLVVADSVFDQKK